VTAVVAEATQKRPAADLAADLLDRVYEIFPKLAERRGQRAGTMSGGERQMLAMGRALMARPGLLMLAGAVAAQLCVIVGRHTFGSGRVSFLIAGAATLLLSTATDGSGCRRPWAAGPRSCRNRCR